MPDREAIIAVENVSKKFAFQVGKAADLRERFASLRRRSRASVREDFWALRDISFTVEPGQPVGIVGHNGSGKSTLLKILNGILRPTNGEVRVVGRVGALIEVGAGFHPELTGRENVYLNGAILGLSRREIAKKFDQIVEFADLAQFIDTPVKRYSSGMYMRLGFSVAAHTNPDILLIDEVLAVGDIFFQNKCLRHLTEFVAQGGSVLFVSHAADQVRSFCERCLWLDHGSLVGDGPAGEVIDGYLALVAEREEEEYRRLHPLEWEQRQEEARERERQEAERQRQAEREREAREAARVTIAGASPVRVLSVETVSPDGGAERADFQTGAPLTVRIAYSASRDIGRAIVGIGINRTSDKIVCYGPNTREDGVPLTLRKGTGTVEITFPELLLLADDYTVDVAVMEGDDMLFYREAAASFTVIDPVGERGVCHIPHTWRHFPEDSELAERIMLSRGEPTATVILSTPS